MEGIVNLPESLVEYVLINRLGHYNLIYLIPWPLAFKRLESLISVAIEPLCFMSRAT